MLASEHPDLALFIDHAGWLARTQQLTRLGLLAWLGQRLTEQAAMRVRERLPLDHPTQRNAEEAVIGVLKRRVERRATRSRAEDVPGRLVDWPKTYLDSPGMVTSRYWTREPAYLPDAAVLGALATMASTWIRVLWDEHSADRQQRCDALMAALDGLPPALRVSAAYTQSVEHRLRRIDPPATMKIRASLDFWTSFFGNDDTKILAQVARDLGRDDLVNGNVDTLLELTAALSIARAALAAPSEDQPPTGPWYMRPVAFSTPDRSYADFELHAGDFMARIAKGVPCTPAGAIAVPDALNSVLGAMGYRATGNQPDIVLTFWKQSAPHSFVVALGDAKRNASGSGENYLRDSVEVAATYVVSYGSLIGLGIHGNQGHGFHGGLRPAVTLFCRQGARRVCGVKGTDIAAIASRFRDDNAEPPAFVTFDMEKHFGPTTGEWSSPVLSAWFGRLARMAWNHLTNR